LNPIFFMPEPPRLCNVALYHNLSGNEQKCYEIDTISVSMFRPENVLIQGFFVESCPKMDQGFQR
jgi:hypothetical protein